MEATVQAPAATTRARTINQLFRDAAKTRGSETALRRRVPSPGQPGKFEWETLTWKTYREASHRIANGLLALDVIRWLGGDESFLGAVTSNEDVKIEHTKQKDAFWFYGMVFVVPLGVLGAGFLATRRRTKKGARRATA